MNGRKVMVTGLPRVVCFSTRSFSTFVTRIRTIPPGGRRPAADDRRGGMGGRVTGGSLVPSLPVSFLNLHLRAVGPDRREVERENGARPTTGRGRKARGMESLEEPRVERDTRRGSHYPSKLFIPPLSSPLFLPTSIPTVSRSERSETKRGGRVASKEVKNETDDTRDGPLRCYCRSMLSLYGPLHLPTYHLRAAGRAKPP